VWQGAPYEGLTCNTLEFVWAYAAMYWMMQARWSLIALRREPRSNKCDLIATDASPAQVVTFAENQTLLAFRDGNAVFMRNWFYAWDRVNQEDSAWPGKLAWLPYPRPVWAGSLGLVFVQPAQDRGVPLYGFPDRLRSAAPAALLAEQPPALSAVFEDARLLARILTGKICMLPWQ